MRVHASDLQAYSRCAAAYGHRRAGLPSRTNSGAAYGSVVHHALESLERMRAEGVQFEEALERSVRTFEHYWHPYNIEAICDPVPADGWLPRRSYGELKARGVETIRQYAELIRFDEHEMLALEYGFVVPIEGTWDDDEGEPHLLAGTVDRLLVRRYTRRSAVCVDDWKGLELDTRIPTPSGWTTMRDVTVGDLVFDETGTPVRVVGKSDVQHKRCYRLTWDDTSSVVCDADHLWSLVVGRDRLLKVMSTAEIAARGVKGEVSPGRWQRDLRILNPGPLLMPERELPIHPYVLGYWLGNGSRGGAMISLDCDDAPHVLERIQACGYGIGARQTKAGSRGETYGILGLHRQLRLAGLLGVKTVPAEYLRASVRQRLDLLRGLMDSDGSAHATRNGQIFTSTDQVLWTAVQDLVAGLGWNYSTWVGPRSGFGKTVTAYEVMFRAADMNPFTLPRKADRVPKKAHRLSTQRIIQEIHEVPSVPTQCISVDSPSSTYLCGDRMTVTHNTAVKEPRFLRHNIQFTAYCYATTRPEFWAGWRGEDGFGAERGHELYQRFRPAGRRATWIDLHRLKFSDAGWRGPIDYARLALAVEGFAAAVKASIYPLSISGDTCQWCDYRATCGGGLPSTDHGNPSKA